MKHNPHPMHIFTFTRDGDGPVTGPTTDTRVLTSIVAELDRLIPVWTEYRSDAEAHCRRLQQVVLDWADPSEHRADPTIEETSEAIDFLTNVEPICSHAASRLIHTGVDLLRQKIS